MAEEKDAEKKAGEGEGDQTQAKDEMIQEEGDDAARTDAEDAIKRVVRQRLDDFHVGIESAMDSFDAWCASQTPENQAHLNTGGFFDFISGQYMQQLTAISDGPIMRTILRELDGSALFASETSSSLDIYTNEAIRRGTRDACWFVRDSIDVILSSQWPDLVQLATNESFEFVPVLYQLGLPPLNFDGAIFGQNLIASGQSYLTQIQPMQEEVAEKGPADEQPADDKKEELQQQAEQDMAQDAEQKEAIAV